MQELHLCLKTVHLLFTDKQNAFSATNNLLLSVFPLLYFIQQNLNSHAQTLDASETFTLKFVSFPSFKTTTNSTPTVKWL